MTLPGVIRRNFRLKLLALVASGVAWTGVVYASNPPETRVISEHVQQEPGSLPSGFVLVQPIAAVDLKVSGTEQDIDSLASSAIHLTVNYSVIHHAGIQQLPLRVVNTDPGIILDSDPTSVQADVDTFTSVSLPVTVRLSPPPPLGYLVQAQTVTPEAVTVTGPTLELKGLHAYVTIPMSDQKTNLATVAQITVLRPGGQVVGNLGVTPATVQVNLTVATTEATRASAVVPIVSGDVAAGYRLTGIETSSPTVVIRGPRDLLNTLDSIPTGTISLTGLNHTETFVVTVLTPAGVTAVPTTVTVTIVVTPLAPATTRATPTAGASPSASPSPTPIA